MDLVYKAAMLTQGGRAGSVQSDDGSFKLKLAVPTEMGGPGGGPSPEMLLAGALAADYEHSLRHIVRLDRLPVKGCYVEATLSLYKTFEETFKMALTLTVHLAGPVDQVSADALVQRARGISPMLELVKNNMTVHLAAVLDTPVTA
ncbi:osmotically inducible protein OsmC [Sphaerotilus hippei]|uniref:Osmotically inducible protein OsmC n=1 Tax=Sphaerotilus hippei TaxID=744406 RepID=A0A318GZW4_9BURK|nr:OsmC family protein [Sphaerotilus hippei]PXW94366.1 osmotically inducible protein OsmC [Sphaerotilus hippei]